MKKAREERERVKKMTERGIHLKENSHKNSMIVNKENDFKKEK
jgi:hypothetical protein